MGILKERLRGEFAGHTLEVRADNHILKGLLYKLFVDDEEVANAQNLLKLPSHRTLRAEVRLDGRSRDVVLEVHQRMLSVEFELTIDGQRVPLEVVE